jgi:hypothetical protein
MRMGWDADGMVKVDPEVPDGAAVVASWLLVLNSLRW